MRNMKASIFSYPFLLFHWLMVLPRTYLTIIVEAWPKLNVDFIFDVIRLMEIQPIIKYPSTYFIWVTFDPSVLGHLHKYECIYNILRNSIWCKLYALVFTFD